ncbi:uncharacterized protein BDR25DRAFT_362697 [Lindgomyces ingoldianus]|uniref:Uncharacterized protein n=1 Tax=Lindgomyces ingoldianus TaxID=673940 RepID=A0ACB6Q910_9PLEO|nr:uncharacterized protein BDR25DRAFT_362697 [Lindgomyces ingoldianus]KAF2463529.1 hypothetical protein BDR25DRAFT_362697 [Lindgomyces ingoldianus]
MRKLYYAVCTGRSLCGYRNLHVAARHYRTLMHAKMALNHSDWLPYYFKYTTYFRPHQKSIRPPQSSIYAIASFHNVKDSSRLFHKFIPTHKCPDVPPQHQSHPATLPPNSDPTLLGNEKYEEHVTAASDLRREWMTPRNRIGFLRRRIARSAGVRVRGGMDIDGAHALEIFGVCNKKKGGSHISKTFKIIGRRLEEKVVVLAVLCGTNRFGSDIRHSSTTHTRTRIDAHMAQKARSCHKYRGKRHKVRNSLGPTLEAQYDEINATRKFCIHEISKQPSHTNYASNSAKDAPRNWYLTMSVVEDGEGRSRQLT